MNTGCPRAPVHDAALQLLQVLDQRFFGNVGPLPATELEAGEFSIFIFIHSYIMSCYVASSYITSYVVSYTDFFPIVRSSLAFTQLLAVNLTFLCITVPHLSEAFAFLENLSFSHCRQTSALSNSNCA